MISYSIKDLEQITGIKAHTLRIWEQRYDFIHPKRTGTNIRYYTDDDLKLVLNITFLKDHGYKIKEINKMPVEEVKQTVKGLIEDRYGYLGQMHALTLAMIELNEKKFEKIFNDYTRKYDLEQTMVQLIFPFLDKMNFQWHTGSVNTIHKQFITNLIRQKLIASIEAVKPVYNRNSHIYLLFGPPEEKSEICLLFSHLILKKYKCRVINLGLNVKPEELDALTNNLYPEYIFITIFNPASQLKISEYLSTIRHIFPETQLLVSLKPYNNQITNDLPAKVKLIASGRKFIEFVHSQR